MEKVKTLFKDHVAPAPSFVVNPTLGNNPAGKPSNGGVSGTVTPKELPVNEIKFGDRK